jgi:hypothetical protein
VLKRSVEKKKCPNQHPFISTPFYSNIPLSSLHGSSETHLVPILAFTFTWLFQLCIFFLILFDQWSGRDRQLV